MTTDIQDKKSIDVNMLGGTKLIEKVDVPPELAILDDGEHAPDGHHMFRVLSSLKGDERLTWDSTSLAEMQAAKKLFTDLIKKGLKPFRVGVNGQATSEVMDEFDPHAEEVIFLPQSLVAGG